MKSYVACLKDATVTVTKRVEFVKKFDGFAPVRKETSLLKSYLIWAKGPGNCLPEAHGYILADEGKLEQLFTLYVGNKKLNLASVPRDVMFAKYQNNQDVSESLLENARRKIRDDAYLMLRRTVEDYKKSDAFKTYLTRAYAIPQFTF